MTPERERHLFVKGRLCYSFGKNGGGLTDELSEIGSIIKLFSKDNYITLHKAFVDQPDDVYDLVFDSTPREGIDTSDLFNDNEIEKS